MTSSLHTISTGLWSVFLASQQTLDNPNNKLMFKVKQLGIDGSAYDWIENWLSNRRQKVVINGTTSDWTRLTSSVPQGSVLRPVLFIIYRNDIGVWLNNFISKFADDRKIGNSIITNRDRLSLQEDLRKISEWSEKWDIPFNVNICHILQIGTRNQKSEHETQRLTIDTNSVEFGVKHEICKFTLTQFVFSYNSVYHSLVGKLSVWLII